MRPKEFNECSSDAMVCAFWLVAMVLSALAAILSLLYNAIFSGRSCFVCTDEDDYLEPEEPEMARHPHFRSR